ncbi:MAG: uroporphyrinogen-III C-methyltransferase, partial [Caldanaerobacter sp.]
MRGIVYIVGAGPGDIGLLTQKALEVIKKADVLVYDRLVNRKIIEMVKESAELIDVGKEPGVNKNPQEEINEILLKKAKEGKKVVRLKGGDPFIFGRGGEEAIYLLENGVSFEIVPGVSSFSAVPSYAGIPLTHRGVSSSFFVMSGHDLEVDWQKIACLNTTLVFLMGISNLAEIAENLIEHGMAPETPSAVIMEGTTPRQRSVFAPLKDIARVAKEEGIKNPAVFVVGKVVELKDKLSWYEKKRLFGKRILITRPKEQAYEMEKALKEEGAEVLVIPTIKIINQKENIREFLNCIEKFNHTVFTSSNAVLSFMEGVRENRYDLRRLKTKIVAIGEKTAKALENFNIYPDLVPEKYTSEDLEEVL